MIAIRCDGNNQLFPLAFASGFSKARFFMALEHANRGCVVTWKTFESSMLNTELCQHVF